MGSWKIIDTLSPRTALMSRSESASRSSPSSSTLPDSIRPGGLATRRRIDSAVTLLPHPLSPTSATVVPRGMSNDTPSTARRVPESVRKVVTRSRTRRSGASSIAEPSHSTDGNVLAMRARRVRKRGRAAPRRSSVAWPSSCPSSRARRRPACARPEVTVARCRRASPGDAWLTEPRPPSRPRGACSSIRWRSATSVEQVARGPPRSPPSARATGRTRLLRFSVPLAPEAVVLEAYVLLERASDVDCDPAPIDLHAARVTAPWDDALPLLGHPTAPRRDRLARDARTPGRWLPGAPRRARSRLALASSSAGRARPCGRGGRSHPYGDGLCSRAERPRRGRPPARALREVTRARACPCSSSCRPCYEAHRAR